MARTILDLTRLLTRSSHSVATGVDRVELAYAKRILGKSDAEAGFAAIVGQRVAPLRRAPVEAFLQALDAKWREGAGDGHAARRLAERLGALLPESPTPAAPNKARDLAWRLRVAAIARAGRPAVAPGNVYVHVSHIRLDRPEPFERLRGSGARLTVLVHDLIPIRFPEYGRPGEDERHARRMTTALGCATTLIANSQATARDLAAFGRERGLQSPPVVVAPLGVESAFAAGVAPLGAPKPYFVSLGTIEPRKNHLTLLHVWRRLAERMGSETPTLVLVGRRGWENEMVLDLLERCPAVLAHVVEANDLPDQALTALVRGARALLFPSFSEGFGLPLAEALALGAPALASDLDVFQEIAGDAAERFDPLDAGAWEDAILDYSGRNPARRDAALSRAECFAPPSWAAHFAAVAEATGGL
ncbi:glycosyltransferase family 4 protein [Hansschlegelia quercus]|uniref:Glycosyltransferase family 1 protein n=1 Tax=Hansschlegelia quercus TaxID=2528245 RepID=A0A4Q9GI35_9HYPH|nr:glycosyltransferase family 1 protein [Hansschlegelia quercus]TBN53869.1 glycosyltransferase family 1 protein [Hansschlegelia quercus]